jgi:hypothetical protein
LRDATFEELVFVLGITKMNKRYGAATSRIGRVENHVLGIYYGIEEGLANLILSQEASRRLAVDNGGLTKDNLNKVLYDSVIDIEKVKGYVKKAFDDDVQTLNIESLGDDDVRELLDYVTSESMKEALESQKIKASEFFRGVNESKKNKRG